MSAMLKLSKERIQHLAKLVCDQLTRNPSVKFLKDRETVKQSVIHALADRVRHDEERHLRVEAKLNEAGVRRGSRKWEEDYRRLVEEDWANDSFD